MSSVAAMETWGHSHLCVINLLCLFSCFLFLFQFSNYLVFGRVCIKNFSNNIIFYKQMWSIFFFPNFLKSRCKMHFTDNIFLTHKVVFNKVCINCQNVSNISLRIICYNKCWDWIVLLQREKFNVYFEVLSLSSIVIINILNFLLK